MRSQGIVVVTPGLKFFPNIIEAEKEVYIEAFVPEPTVEAFHEAILDGPPRPYKIELNACLVGPRIHSPAAKFSAIVDGYGRWQAPSSSEPLKAKDHLLACHGKVGPELQTLTGILIDQRQDTEIAAVLEPLRNKVHRPTVIYGGSSGQRHTYVGDAFAPMLAPHGEALRSIEPKDAPSADLPAFPLEHNQQPSVAKPYSGERQLLEPAD